MDLSQWAEYAPGRSRPLWAGNPKKIQTETLPKPRPCASSFVSLPEILSQLEVNVYKIV